MIITILAKRLEGRQAFEDEEGNVYEFYEAWRFPVDGRWFWIDLIPNKKGQSPWPYNLLHIISAQSPTQ